MNERWTPAYDRMFKPDHELAQGDPACRRWAWIDLCHMARWEDGHRIVGGTAIALRRGELVASFRYLADRWGWSVKKVRTFMTLLVDVEKLGTVRDTPKGTVYRIVNYERYANPGHSEGHSEEHDRGTGGAQRTTGYTSGNNDVARAVGEFCERTGTRWALKTGIGAWADEICREPRHAGIDVASEIRECAEWWEGKGKRPRPDRAIRNWLKRARPSTNGNGQHWSTAL